MTSRLNDRGFSLMMVALSLMLLLGVAAFAIDLSAMRLDRALDQRVADAAASAGALGAYETNGQTGCETAIAYVQLNAPQIGPLATAGCSTVPATCDPATPTEVTQTVGRFTVTMVYPVPDGNALMNPGAVGAGSQGVVAADGNPCERFGVRIAATHQASFAQVMGWTQGTTTVHAVARAFLPPPSGTPINLLILDRFGCQALKASGNGGILVTAIFDPDTGTLLPGEAAVDSDGSSGCPFDGGVIDIDGTNAVMRADGPVGCPNQTGTETFSGLLMGHGCGLIRTIAPGTPGCNWPACTASGGANPNNPNPLPTAMAARLTRAPVDHRYNCRVDYSVPDLAVTWAADPLTVSNEQVIPGCSSGGDHIYDLIKTVGQSGSPGVGWSTWSSSYPCDIPSSQPAISISGNWWIDCAAFNVRTSVTITGGSAVADGNVAITSNTGHLAMNNTGAPGYLFLRNGLFRKDGQASITLNETMVYASKTSRVQMDGGGSGSLTWVAPDDPAHPFDDLALWSDSTVTVAPHIWAGQAGLVMEGAFFVPIVTVEYAGTASQNQTEAQFIADKLHARGQGVLKVSPIADRAVGIRPPPRSVLIR
jgi:hypothetical protein